MARILSFGWTTPAILAGRKTRTARDWEPAYAQLFHAGDEVEAWDKSPKYGGRRVATIRLTREPYRLRSDQMPEEAYEREGFAYLDETGWRPLPIHLSEQERGLSSATRKMWRELFDRWRSGPVKTQYVLEFALLSRN